MADIDVTQWLEQWVEEHLTSSVHVDRKSEMRDWAKACADDAQANGISIAELKEAANGDLETFLVERQNVASSDKDTGLPS